MLTRKQRNLRSEEARRFFESLSNSERWQVNDDLVLGDFDWMDWFYEPPKPGFLRELSELLEHWEQRA